MRLRSQSSAQFTENEIDKLKPEAQMLLSLKSNPRNSYSKLYSIAWPEGLVLCTYCKQFGSECPGSDRVAGVYIILRIILLIAEARKYYSLRNKLNRQLSLPHKSWIREGNFLLIPRKMWVLKLFHSSMT